MASVYLTSSNSVANDTRTDNFSQLRRSALTGRAPTHHVVATPEEADIILFSNSLFVNQADIRSHFLTKKFAEKIFVYSTTDRQVPFFPGVYACTERRWYIPAHMRSGFYIKVLDHDWIRPSPINEEAPYLFSFCGSFDTHPFRARMASLNDPRGFIRDTSNDDGRAFGKSADTYQRWHAEYFRILKDSMFVLCPRGADPSSFRIFEAMKAGRAPVIIADEWEPPVGPNWNEFSLRVPEARLGDVPQILENFVDRATEMGCRASQSWERWFSMEAAFQTIVTWCVQILEAQQHRGVLQRCRPLLQLARPYFFRHVVLPAAKSFCRGRSIREHDLAYISNLEKAAAVVDSRLMKGRNAD
jgi:hypothetical protein